MTPVTPDLARALWGWPVRLATTGLERAMASTSTRPMPSFREGSTNTSKADMTAATSGRHPGKRTFPAKPSASACSISLPFNSPSPRKSKVVSG